MSWVALGAAAITAGGSVAAAHIGRDKGDGDDVAVGGPAGGYYEDPAYYQALQPRLGVGRQLAAGGVPTGLEAVVTPGGGEFQRMLESIRGRTLRGAEEQLTRRGITRGGLASSIAQRSLSNIIPGLRYQEFERALKGRERLFGKGLDVLSGVGTQALQASSMRNQFNLMMERIRQADKASQRKLQAAKAKSTGGMFGDIGGGMGSLMGLFGGGQQSVPEVTAYAPTSAETTFDPYIAPSGTAGGSLAPTSMFSGGY